jgi:tripartite-type tricarboxylate transporter receptor subunit TctC
MPTASAQTFPTKPVTIVLGYPPGGSVDLTARAIAPSLEKVFRQPVVIQNRAGAAGGIGAQIVAIAEPDGYTISIATTQLSVLPAVDRVMGKAPNFTRDQFAPIALLSADPSLLFSNAERPWKNVQDLIADARAKPDGIIYASGGLYGSTHLPIEMFLKAAGAKMRHLPTSGGGPALTAVLGNNAGLLAAHPGVGGPQARAGKLRALVNLGAKRIDAFADVPTMKELGHDLEYYQWIGAFAPVKTPPAILEALRKAFQIAAQDPDFKQAMTRSGSGVEYLDGDAFRAWWDKDSRMLEGVVQAIGKM